MIVSVEAEIAVVVAAALILTVAAAVFVVVAVADQIGLVKSVSPAVMADQDDHLIELSASVVMAAEAAVV